MDATDSEDRPPVEAIESVFRVYEIRRDGDKLLYVGKPAVSADVLEREVWPTFREYDYEVSLKQRYEPETGPPLLPGNYALVAKPRSVGIDGIPWANIVFALLTVLSTLFVGTMYYDIDVSRDPLNALGAWPFTAAILGVLGIHELGHYVMSRYYDVEASLPYFLPFPTIIGTAGAVIRMKGRIPNRKALFDIGIAGPLAGLVATVVVTIIGLYLEPVTISMSDVAQENAVLIDFNYPIMLHLLADLTGQPLSYPDPATSVNPVVMGGWVGMFITFLNLLPVGQLDGGHIVRAILGERTETFSAFVPAGLFGLAGYLHFAGGGNAVGIWVFWGVFALLLAYAGPATPIRDDPLDQKRIALGALTFGIGLLCFTPVPIEIVSM